MLILGYNSYFVLYEKVMYKFDKRLSYLLKILEGIFDEQHGGHTLIRKSSDFDESTLQRINRYLEPRTHLL